jgi:hypothetical protein
MSDPTPNPTDTPPADDPLAHLHKMSTTAGLGTTDYVAVNGTSIVALILGLASGLSLFDRVLLAIPVVAIVLAIIAIVQIRDSNGTQTGKGLAALGILLALLFVGLVGGKAVAETYTNREDEIAIEKVIADLDQTLRAGKYSDAYDRLFAERFTSRFTEQTFMETWKHMVEGTKESQGMTDMKSNGRTEFDVNPDTEQKTAVSMAIMDFGPNSARLPIVFLKDPSGAWKVSDIPDLFKTPPQGRAR